MNTKDYPTLHLAKLISRHKTCITVLDFAVTEGSSIMNIAYTQSVVPNLLSGVPYDT